MRQTACVVFNPIMVEGYAALFSCTAVVQASDSMTASMCSQCWYFSHEPSSLFHHSVLVDLSVSMMMY